MGNAKFTLLTGNVRRAALSVVTVATLVGCLTAPGAAFAAGSGTAASRAEPMAVADGAISGTVSGPGGAPLVAGTSGEVGVFTSSGGFVGTEPFSDDGAYSVTGLAAGDYKLGFATSATYVLNWWRNAPSLSKATPVHVVAGATTGGISPQLLIGGTITGTVTGPGGTPLAADTVGSVAAVNRTGDVVGNGSFHADGAYTISALATGEVKLSFEGRDGRGIQIYAPSWWRNAATVVTAEPVQVTAGATTGGVDQRLAPAGSITGTITGPAGVPLATGTTGTVTVFSSSGTWLDATPFSDDGSYKLTGLAAGDYKLQFLTDPTGTGAGYESTWWHDATSLGTATLVHVDTGGTTGNVSPRLALNGSIAGTVTGPAGAPLATGTEGQVLVSTSAGRRVGSFPFAADGAYSADGLAAGDYKVQFEAWDAGGEQDYVPSWWQNAATSATATIVHVGNGAVTGHIDPQLTAAGSITGIVSGPAGEPLVAGTNGIATAYDSSGNVVGSGWFADSGVYSIGGLAPGDYTVGFKPDAGDDNYVPVWWRDAASRAAATVVHVALGSTTSGIDQHLTLYGSIAGTVSGPAGTPLAMGTKGEVSAFDSAGRLVSVQRFSADGTYEIGKLTAGDYRLKFQAYDTNGNPGYRSGWWRNASSLVAATTVPVTPGVTTSTIDPHLAALPAPVAPMAPMAPVAPVAPVAKIPRHLPTAVRAKGKKAVRLPVRTDTGQVISWASSTPRVCRVVRGVLRVSGRRAVCRVTASVAVGGRSALHRHYRIRVS